MYDREDFFDEKMVQLSFLSLSKALSLLERLAGKDFFHPLLEFINLIISRKDHFRLQLTHVKNLLNAPTTSRIIVTQKPIAGALLNRTLWHLPDPLAARHAFATGLIGEEVKEVPGNIGEAGILIHDDHAA